MTQDMGGGGSFSDHIKSHTDFIKVFKTMDLTYTSTVKVGNEQVSVTDASSPGGDEITEEELANFNDNDLDM